MTKREEKEFWHIADIVLYADLDDDTIEYVWQTESLTEAVKRYKELKN